MLKFQAKQDNTCFWRQVPCNKCKFRCHTLVGRLTRAVILGSNGPTKNHYIDHFYRSSHLQKVFITMGRGQFSTMQNKLNINAETTTMTTTIMATKQSHLMLWNQATPWALKRISCKKHHNLRRFEFCKPAKSSGSFGRCWNLNNGIRTHELLLLSN